MVLMPPIDRLYVLQTVTSLTISQDLFKYSDVLVL